MKHFFSFIKKIFPSAGALVVSLVLGLSIGGCIYLGLLQRHFFSYRYALYGILLSAAGTILTAWLNRKFILPFFKRFSRQIQVFILLITLLLGVVLLLNTKLQPTYYILPDSQLEMRFTIPKLPSEEEGVRLLWVETGQGYVHYSTMQIDGKWERLFGNTIFASGQQVHITWSGKAGQTAEIVFRHTDYDQPVEITWNGQTRVVNLNQPRNPDVIVDTPIHVPWVYFIPYTLTFILSVGYALFSLLVLLGTWNPVRSEKSSSWTWLLYMLPMLAAWGFALLIFWPGIMSTDALTQWGMAVTGQYNDWQSAFHALILAGLMRIWYSPAFVSGIQVFLLALTAAWGLHALEQQGVRRIFLWAIALIFAVLPVNMLLSVTLWKDIPYAIAFLWLTGVVIHIALSQGEWLRKPLHWVVLVLSAFLVSVFRQNGAGVALLALLLLIVFFRSHWKVLVGCLAAAILLFTLTKGPLYTAIGLDRTSTGQSNLIYLHHIAAHLDAGTKISEADRDYLNSFLPLNDWDYWCCYVGTISYDNQFDRDDFLMNTSRNRNLAIKLFLRDPLVDFTHATCAAELTWKFENNQCYMKSTHGINTWQPGHVDWIGKNDYGLEDHSLLPSLVDPAVSYLRKFGFLDDMLVVYLRPAFWLYLGIFGVSIAVFRRRNLNLFSTLVPALSQTLILFLVSFAPAYRYHYGTLLAGILLVGMAFLPEQPKDPV